MDDLERQRQSRLDRDAVMDTPNCPRCLHRMEPAEVEREIVWRCSDCDTTAQP